MLRGTRCMMGGEALLFRAITTSLCTTAQRYGYEEFIPSALCESEVFVNKAGPQILDQMYTFTDKGKRDICLIPEVTAVAQKLYKEEWKALPKPVNIYYLTRCYRYERPQAGRYREFWQFGVESMGGKTTKGQMIDMLQDCLNSVWVPQPKFTINPAVKRGLSYYIEDGFEAEIASLGAQKQVAGGGRYDVGIGWAIGVDRLMLALQQAGA